MSICSPEGLAAALDYDVIFSCVDRPWPRAVLNGIAYSDVIPVIDGGINIDTFPDGRMRGASWRVQVVAPGMRALDCSGQIRMPNVVLDQQGLLEDEAYIAQAGLQVPASQNVALLSASVSAGQLAQFVSLVASPGGRGASGPLRYLLAAHFQEHLDPSSHPGCHFERLPGEGDRRIPFVREEGSWVEAFAQRHRRAGLQGWAAALLKGSDFAVQTCMSGRTRLQGAQPHGRPSLKQVDLVRDVAGDLPVTGCSAW